MIDADYDTIHAILEQYPAAEWFDRCRGALPDLSDGEIFRTLEAMAGGDAREVEDDE